MRHYFQLSQQPTPDKTTVERVQKSKQSPSEMVKRIKTTARTLAKPPPGDIVVPELLKSVSAVCRAHARLDTLPHVAQLIDSFAASISNEYTLEYVSMSLPKSLPLMNRVKRKEWAGVSSYFRKQRLKFAIKNSIKERDFAAFQWWMTEYMPEHQDETIEFAFNKAIKANFFRVLTWLQKNGKIPRKRPDLGRFGCSSAKMVYWLHENTTGPPLTIRLHRNDCKLDFDFVKWAHEHREEHILIQTESVLTWINRSGRIDILEWWHENRTEQCSRNALDDTVSCNRLATAKWICEHYPKGHFIDPTSASRDFGFIKWLALEYTWENDSNRTIWAVKTMKAVANRDDADLEIFKSLLSLCPKGAGLEALQKRARHGNLMAVQLLIEHGAPVTTEAIHSSAEGGHLNVLQLLHENGKQCSAPNTMDFAAAENHINVVKWLHANRSEGCSTNAMDYAATSGHLEMVQWLHANRSEGCTTKAMDGAASKGHLEVVQWLHANRSEGCTVKAMDKAAEHNHLETVEWLHDNRREGCTTSAMDMAAFYGHFEMVKWLHENRTEGCTSKAMNLASRYGRFKVVEYLHVEHGEEFTPCVLENAATNGHNDILELAFPAFEGDCSEDLLRYAAIEGHFATVKLLALKYDAYFDECVLSDVADTGHFAITEWLMRYLVATSDFDIDSPFLDRSSLPNAHIAHYHS